MSSKGKFLLGLFTLCCILSIAAELSITREHSVFAWETWPGFYAVYGFLSCSVLVLLSKHVLRPLIMRDEEEPE
jgi:hypothetical protein